MKPFTPTESSLFFTRQDAADPRLGELVKRQPISEGVAIVGYPDDEGVRINGGREGAKAGPDAVRKWLYRMTPHPRRSLKPFADLGNLQISGTLEERHQSVVNTLSPRLADGMQVLSFGGGNDYAFADGMAFLKAFAPHKPLVINVDAHFDVRGLERGLSSGTPFYRLLECGIEFDFVEYGIQGHCNAREHWEYVESKGGRILTMEDMLDSGVSLTEFTVRELDDLILKPRPAFIAIDIDAFAWPYAAGSSASWPIGLQPHAFLPVLNLLLKRLDVRAMGVYEVAPPLDHGDGTAKLAAQLAHAYLHYYV